ncbi:MAG: NUDIX domain-containing protein [Rhodospirillaceae bacterium]|nr:NUDIX domain-containing protein [Rhodospirillaceae bacterium]
MLRPLATLLNRSLRVYWRITKPVTFGVRAVVLGPDGRLLLVKHTYDRFWYLPGGGMKRGEEAEAALARELREELGIAALAIERRLGTYVSTREGKRDTIAVFVARAEAIGRRQRLEIAAAEWFDPAQPPPDISPATRRRIEEFQGQRPAAPDW